MTLRDDGREIRLYNVVNPHVEGMLIGQIVSNDIVWVTDLYSPVRDTRRTPAAVYFYETLKQLGLRPSRLAGGHGGASSYTDLEAIER